MANKQLFKPDSHADKFCRLANVDWETGYSDDIPKDVLVSAGFVFGNGGGWCRTDGPLGRVFNITRTIERGHIASVKLDGYNKSVKSVKISGSVRKEFKGSKCVVLNIGGNYIEIDHKDGRKDDLTVDADANPANFQPLHKTVNVAKRDHCKECVLTGIRFNARYLGYSVAQWIGDNVYRGSCIGCYWYSPYIFNQEVSKGYIRSK
jgi:hypothetical protein